MIASLYQSDPAGSGRGRAASIPSFLPERRYSRSFTHATSVVRVPGPAPRKGSCAGGELDRLLEPGQPFRRGGSHTERILTSAVLLPRPLCGRGDSLLFEWFTHPAHLPLHEV